MLWWELQNEIDFDHVKTLKEGFIIIIDTTGNKIHRTSCPNIYKPYFIQKVIKNRKKNGTYYYTDTLALAVKKWNPEWCLQCK
ncbi:hypothetical protein G3578_00050 [Brevibacillus sp. SYP-B805]|uniref:hypothetical protein n=1 Tax=Brevibacillus sp. SYP-B805 TaxID=1578199 RepID=UPI0013EC5C41|nr:hypothetical protein [Brevibacillus sp. SYP-B805]NGQ93570.1 hypothetical protein [Brevibacillus sp. SYP-B805]